MNRRIETGRAGQDRVGRDGSGLLRGGFGLLLLGLGWSGFGAWNGDLPLLQGIPAAWVLGVVGLACAWHLMRRSRLSWALVGLAAVAASGSLDDSGVVHEFIGRGAALVLGSALPDQPSPSAPLGDMASAGRAGVGLGAVVVLCLAGLSYPALVAVHERWRKICLICAVPWLALLMGVLTAIVLQLVASVGASGLHPAVHYGLPLVALGLLWVALLGLDQLLRYLGDKARGPRGRATLFLLSGNLGLAVLQAFQFLFLARWLGAEEFGRIAAVNALLMIVVPFADLGFGNLLQMRCARNIGVAAREFGAATVVTVLSGTCIAVLLVPLAAATYGTLVPALLVLCVGFAELVCFRVVWVTGQLFAAYERFAVTSVFYALPLVSRTLALTVSILPDATPTTWGVAVLVCALPPFLYALYRGIGLAGGWEIDWSNLRSSARTAIAFSLGTVAQGTYTDLDKVLLGRFGGAAELGAYTSAYRIIAMASMPVRSLLQATSSRYFRVGNGGLSAALAVSSDVARLSVPYACLAAVAVYCTAPLLPHVLGPTFESAVEMVRLIAALPVLQALQTAYSDALTGAGLQAVRTRLQVLTVLAYGAVGLYLIPRFGWAGAVATCYVGEITLIVVVLSFIRVRRKPGRRPPGIGRTAREPSPVADRPGLNAWNDAIGADSPAASDTGRCAMNCSSEPAVNGPPELGARRQRALAASGRGGRP